jgi:HSP20 family protein
MRQISVRRGDPFGSLVDDVFSDFFLRAGLVPAAGAASPTVAPAKMDVVDKGGEFEVKLDLPGVNKDDINVAIEGARVTLQAEARRETESRDGERVLVRERSVSRYARSFELPAEVSEEGAAARFENGVLTLTLPKRVAVTSKRLEVH